MSDGQLQLRFDPQTIKHLGVRMYSTLPPALAELVSNSYDADASEVTISLAEHDGKPARITVSDNGCGLSFEAINQKFLVIGRNRRQDEGDAPSPKYRRLPTGKKGLGKLALFGLAKRITVRTNQRGKSNIFVLDWDQLTSAHGSYNPQILEKDLATNAFEGTELILEDLKRESPFDVQGIADSLSRIFLFDDTFRVIVVSPSGDRIALNNQRKYSTITAEFEWDMASSVIVPAGSAYENQLSGKLITAKSPITPASGLRGISLFSRGKLVNAPEFFSDSTSSHFYQYLSGWITVDFIDLFAEDVISTNRQSIDWEHVEMARLRAFLTGVVARVGSEWRVKRKETKTTELEQVTGIDTQRWIKTLPEKLRDPTQKIVDSLGGEDALETYTPVIKALHEMIPEYPLLHWRHLHPKLKERVVKYYENAQYGDAASQGVQIYCEVVRQLATSTEDGADLVSKVFGSRPFNPLPKLQLTPLVTESEINIQQGQGHLSRGIVSGFRNPIAHAPIDSSVPAVFSELDCLNILSLASYLIFRLDRVTVN